MEAVEPMWFLPREHGSSGFVISGCSVQNGRETVVGPEAIDRPYGGL